MPTILTHAAVGLAATRLAYPRRAGAWLYVCAATLSVLPDADVVAGYYGIPYGHPIGHRGFSHSILFAALMASFATRNLFAGRLDRWKVGLLLFAVAVSHGVLDAFTNGGLGIGFLVPFDLRRFFFPFHPIQVSPIGVRAVLDDPEGVLEALGSEALWVWVPLTAVLLGVEVFRSHREVKRKRQANDLREERARAVEKSKAKRVRKDEGPAAPPAATPPGWWS